MQIDGHQSSCFCAASTARCNEEARRCIARFFAFAALSSADFLRAAARMSFARSAGGSFPSGSTSRSSRARMTSFMTSEWSSRAWYRDQRALAAIFAR